MRVRSWLAVAAMLASSVAVAIPNPSVAAAPSGAPVPSFVDVACPGPTSCFAVGTKVSGDSSTFRSLIEHWNGRTWSIVASPNAKEGGFLFAVSCPATTSCMAVGGTGIAIGSTNRAFASRWDGAHWTIVAVPSPPRSVYATLWSVSCASPTMCFASGEFETDLSGPPQTFMERWNGSAWSVVKNPNLSGTSLTRSGVSCPSATVCFAVGHGDRGATVARWSGTTWTVTTLGTPSWTLTSVSCISPSSCYAVGSETVGSLALKTLVARWNGTSWKRVPSPNRSDGYEHMLADVTCTSLTSCLVVGRVTLTHQGPGYTYAQRWDGKAWAQMKTPRPHPNNNGLSGVACATTTKCFAVGYSDSPAALALIEAWNGKSWSLAAHPEPQS